MLMTIATASEKQCRAGGMMVIQQQGIQGITPRIVFPQCEPTGCAHWVQSGSRGRCGMITPLTTSESINPMDISLS